MKKISVMFAVFFCSIMTMTLLTACKDDNEDSPTPTSSSTDKDLVGDWVADLTGKTYIENLRTEGMNVLDMNAEAIALKLYDPDMLQLYMEMSSLLCPAEEYVFAVWGHGDGFDPSNDVPGKYTAPAKTRGVLSDEWNNEEKLDMYELTQAIKGTGHAPFKTIFFHNCLMGNIETLTELRDVAEYIVCSSHELISEGELLTFFVKELIDTKSTATEMQNGNAQNTNIEDTFAQMLQDVTPFWQESYITEEPTAYLNGDLKLIRTKGLNDIIDVCKRLASRLIELYPQNPEPINLAIRQVYRFAILFDDPDFGYFEPFFDLQDYADKLAENTADPTLATIAKDMKKALDTAIINHVDVNWNEQHLEHYSLSICLYHQIIYNRDFKARGLQWLCNINEGYEQSTFHQLTGWGNWLRINNGHPLGNPTSGGGEPLTKE